jgi:hypothetical protein
MQGPAELSNPASERATKVRDPAGAKEDKDDGEDNQ